MGTQLQALELWRHSLVASVRGDEPDLSARQMALLLTVYIHKGPHTVRGMAKTLNISKPAISRALDRLGELGLVRRERDDLDRRNVLVQKTSGGVSFLSRFAELVTEAQTHVAAMAIEDIKLSLEPDPAPAESATYAPTTWAEAVA